MSMARTNARLFLVLCLAVGSTAATITLGSSHKDESNGFQIQLPRKWEQVPTKFQEVSLIGRWAGKAKRGRITPECRVIRLLRVAPQAEVETPADAVKRGIPGYADVLRKQPKDMWEYLKALMPPTMELIEDNRGVRAHMKSTGTVIQGRPKQAQSTSENDVKKITIKRVAPPPLERNCS